MAEVEGWGGEGGREGGQMEHRGFCENTYDTYNDDYILIYLSKPIECIILRENCNVNYRLGNYDVPM